MLRPGFRGDPRVLVAKERLDFLTEALISLAGFAKETRAFDPSFFEGFIDELLHPIPVLAAQGTTILFSNRKRRRPFVPPPSDELWIQDDIAANAEQEGAAVL